MHDTVTLRPGLASAIGAHIQSSAAEAEADRRFADAATYHRQAHEILTQVDSTRGEADYHLREAARCDGLAEAA